MIQLIGNKSHIAIEYSIENQDRFIGFAKLWVKNSFFGSLYDTIFIDGYLIGGLNEALLKNKLDNRYSYNEHYKTYDLFNKDILFGDDDSYELANSYRINFGTWSDYFDIYSYRLSDNTGAFLWRLVKRDDNLKDLVNYPSSIFYETFHYDEVFKLIEYLNAIKTYSIK